MIPPSWLLDGLIAGAAAATLAAVLRAILPRAGSAAARHDAHLVVIVVALVGFAVGGCVPRIELALLPAREAADVVIPGLAQESTLQVACWIVWAIVAAALLARRAAAQWTLMQFAGNATALESRVWSAVLADSAERMGIRAQVRIVTHPAVIGGVTFGMLQPVIVLAEEARRGTSDRWRAVLLHELAHVQRRDHQAGAAADVATALFWFLPWIVHSARAMRIEREVACDDLVVSLGARPSGYGAVLIDLFRRQQRAWSTLGARLPFEWDALANLAGASSAPQFETRLRALLRVRGDQGRTPASRTFVLGAAALGACLLSSLQLVQSSAPRPLALVAATNPAVQQPPPAPIDVEPRSDLPELAVEGMGTLAAPVLHLTVEETEPRVAPASSVDVNLTGVPEALRAPVRQAIGEALGGLAGGSEFGEAGIRVVVVRRTLVLEGR